MSGTMRYFVSNTKSGRIADGLLVLNKGRIISGGNHGPTINVSTRGGVPCRVKTAEIMISTGTIRGQEQLG